MVVKKGGMKKRGNPPVGGQARMTLIGRIKKG
jgi:hypothetical protein